jgi:prophage maintenance system killer protein
MRGIYFDTQVLSFLNKHLLEVSPVKKADQHKVMSHKKLHDIAMAVREQDGDLYVKAAALLDGIVCQHPFASGNKRTAFFSTKAFIELNGGVFRVPDVSNSNDESNRKVLTGIREGFYTRKQIIEWLRNGEIDEFVRR